MTSTNQADLLGESLKKCTRRKLPKLKICLQQKVLDDENRERVEGTKFHDKNYIRRVKLPLWKCIIMELREDGHDVCADFVQDLIDDNIALISQDYLGVTVDLRKYDNYIEMIGDSLREAEKFKLQDEKIQESKVFLKLALFFAKQEKGILWLSAKLFLVSIAIASLDHRDAGRFRTLCNLFYAKFLINNFPCEGVNETDELLMNIRDSSIGRKWTLFEKGEEDLEVPDSEKDAKIFTAVSVLENQTLLLKVRNLIQSAPEKAETYGRLAERRAIDASRLDLQADSLIEIGKSQLASKSPHNAVKSLTKAFEINESIGNIHGVCEAKMHLSAAKQRLGDTETAIQLLTEMGALAIQHRERYQLARALQLLGELHLRNDMPDLAIQHLYEAFTCYMGLNTNRYSMNSETNFTDNVGDPMIELGPEENPTIFRHEADHTRFLMAVAAGQQHIASFHDLINESAKCNVVKAKENAWKSSRRPWWFHFPSYDLISCVCPKHQRSPVDILRKQLEEKRLKHEEEKRLQLEEEKRLKLEEEKLLRLEEEKRIQLEEEKREESVKEKELVMSGDEDDTSNRDVKFAENLE